jgi:hypothetical protein
VLIFHEAIPDSFDLLMRRQARPIRVASRLCRVWRATAAANHSKPDPARLRAKNATRLIFALEVNAAAGGALRPMTACWAGTEFLLTLPNFF